MFGSDFCLVFLKLFFSPAKPTTYPACETYLIMRGFFFFSIYSSARRLEGNRWLPTGQGSKKKRIHIQKYTFCMYVHCGGLTKNPGGGV